MQNGDFSKVPRPPSCVEELPARTIILEHPTHIPLFGDVFPTVTMHQKLILLDEKECWI
jgi:hypothetical protein